MDERVNVIGLPDGFAEDMMRLCAAVERCAGMLERLADRPQVLLVPPSVEPLIVAHGDTEEQDEAHQRMLRRLTACRDAAEARGHTSAGIVRLQHAAPERVEIIERRIGACPACGNEMVDLDARGHLLPHARPDGSACPNAVDW